MLLVLVIGVLLAVLAQPQRQRRAVDEIRRLGGNVQHLSGEDASIRRGPVVEPNWLRTLFGEQSVRVREVDLSSSLVTDADLEILETLKDIRVLHLQRTHISDAALVHLVGLPHLEELWLQETDITNDGLAALSDLPSLHTLNLDNTRVTAEALIFLRRMPKLERVTMLGLDLNSQDLHDADAVNRKLRFLNRSDVVSDPQLLDEIIQAWNARQDSIRSLAVKCAGTLTERGQAFQVAFELVVDSQGRLRVSHQGKEVLGGMGTSSQGKDRFAFGTGLVDRDSIDVCDGKCQTRFHAKSAGCDYPTADIHNGNIDWCTDLRFLPLAIAYRPLQCPNGGALIAKENLAVSQNVATIDGDECIGLYHSQGMVWVSPSRDYLPMQYVESCRGVTCLDVRLSYSKEAEHEWVPSSWKMSLIQQDRTSTYRYEVKVDEYRVNEPIADSVFEITYPPGTLFRDQINNETYVLCNDGTRMPILLLPENWGEIAANIREIRDSKPDGHSKKASDSLE